MVNFVETMKVVGAFVSNVLTLSFFGFGTFGNFVLVCIAFLLVGFVLRSIWGGDDSND